MARVLLTVLVTFVLVFLSTQIIYSNDLTCPNLQKNSLSKIQGTINTSLIIHDKIQSTYCDGFSTLFCDDFENGADPNWIRSGDASAIWEVIDGTWHAILTGYKRLSYQSIGDNSWTDFVLEMDWRGNAGVDKSVTCRGYNIYFRSDWNGKDELIFAAPGGYRDTVEYPSANGTWYHLKIRCEGTLISISIDGTVLITYEDINQLSMSGGVTLVVYSGAPSICDMNFDNIIITEIAVCCTGIRGNVDGDALDQIDISDLVGLVAYMFQGGAEPPCMEEADVDGAGGIDISDLVGLVGYMFQGGIQPALCP